ncbi:Exodeoxyribonuclease VII small subunit [Lachnospiraceae bacterium]|nr:Exodeoxyribonuclease VII small subunit [Lachnospiraceae bacterium]
MSPRQKKEKELTIEEGFSFLEESLKKLSDEDISLEESFAVFEKGMQVLKDVSGKIDEVEKKVKVINEEGGMDDFQ